MDGTTQPDSHQVPEIRPQRMVFIIPRDPESESPVFLTGMPYGLQDRMDPIEWKEIIEGLNQITIRRESPSALNLLRLLLIFPVLLKTDTLDEEVNCYLDLVNKKLSSKGINIAYPSFNGYIELEIIVINGDGPANTP